MAIDALRRASVRRPRLGRDRGGPRPGAAHPQGPPGPRAVRRRPARGVRLRPRAARRRRRLTPGAPCALFVAAWPDEPTRRRLAALELGPRRTCAWSGPTRWHVTLRFLGDVTDEQRGAAGEALRGVRRRAARSGRVPARARDRVVHRGAGPAAARRTASTALAAAVRDATAPSCRSRRRASRPSTATSPWPGPRGGWARQAQADLAGHPLRVRLRRGARRPGGLGALDRGATSTPRSRAGRPWRSPA